MSTKVLGPYAARHPRLAGRRAVWRALFTVSRKPAYAHHREKKNDSTYFLSWPDHTCRRQGGIESTVPFNQRINTTTHPRRDQYRASCEKETRLRTTQSESVKERGVGRVGVNSQKMTHRRTLQGGGAGADAMGRARWRRDVGVDAPGWDDRFRQLGVVGATSSRRGSVSRSTDAAVGRR